jgi:hypothetical protein
MHMSRPLQIGVRVAKLSLIPALWILAVEAIDVWVGAEPNWPLILFGALLPPLTIGIGGVLYGIMLPMLPSRRTLVAAGAHFFTGAGAGATAGALWIVPFTWVTASDDAKLFSVLICLYAVFGGIAAILWSREETATAPAGQ